MKRAIVMCCVLVIFAACTKDTSEWSASGSSATPTTKNAVAAPLEDLEKQCIESILQLTRAREGSRTAALKLSVHSMQSCAGFCTSTQPAELRAETCNVPTTYLREACNDRVVDCTKLCADAGAQSFIGKTACSATSSETATLRMGDKVKAQWRNGLWYSGTITAVYSDGTADVRYDDGDRSKGLPFSKIKLVKRPMFEAATGN